MNHSLPMLAVACYYCCLSLSRPPRCWRGHHTIHPNHPDVHRPPLNDKGALAFMIQWPTLITLVQWPFITAMYACLAGREERNVLIRHPVEYPAYMEQTPMFFPLVRGTASSTHP